ncbi:mesoderm induction early response protein 2 isoform X2 [Ascaphus truei]|uniref:mesoderm induction early response protein 2 isoform X2 n=1 Tax=Ascaphus truei TaxID=8439 RepID=UPI003F59CF81
MHRSHPGHAAPPAPVRGVAETHSPFGSFHFLVFILITNFPKKQNPTERVAIAGEGLSLAGILTRKCGGHGAEDEQEGALSWGNGEMGRSFPDTQEQKAKGGVPESGEMPPCGTPSLSPHSTNSLSPACHKEAATPLSLSSEDPQDRTLSPDVGEKEMMVGSQAQLPFLRYTPAGERDYENVDQLLWDPSILPECEVEEYLSRASERQREVWEGSPFDESRVKDNEQALYELVRCRFHTEEALRRLHFNVKVVQDGLCAWSEEERRNFEHGFRVHGKNFNLIQANKVRTRSVGECVQYYYFWKKSERYEYYTQQTRLGKRKLNGNPSAAEYEYEVSELESAVGLHGAIYSGGLGVGASAGILNDSTHYTCCSCNKDQCSCRLLPLSGSTHEGQQEVLPLSSDLVSLDFPSPNLPVLSGLKGQDSPLASFSVVDLGVLGIPDFLAPPSRLCSTSFSP